MNRRRTGKPILELYAFVAADGLGEGLVAFNQGNTMYPMVGADAALVEDLKVFARNIAGATGRKITLVKFTQRTEMEVIKP